MHWKLFINLQKENQDSKIREWKKKLGAEGESIQNKDDQQKEKKPKKPTNLKYRSNGLPKDSWMQSLEK